MCSKHVTSQEYAFKFLGKSYTFCYYIFNKISVKTLNRKIPFEAWIGIKPFITHMKVFGNVYYVHVPKICVVSWIPRINLGFSWVILMKAKFIKFGMLRNERSY